VEGPDGRRGRRPRRAILRRWQEVPPRLGAAGLCRGEDSRTDHRYAGGGMLYIDISIGIGILIYPSTGQEVSPRVGAAGLCRGENSRTGVYGRENS